MSGVLMTGMGWSFFHGPGLDAPLMGYFRGSTQTRLLYWVTDGAGRELAVADSLSQPTGVALFESQSEHLTAPSVYL